MCLYPLDLAALLEEDLNFKGHVYQNELLANGWICSGVYCGEMRGSVCQVSKRCT